MSFVQILAIGFVLGIVVAGLSFLALLARYKFEQFRSNSANEAAQRRLGKSESQRANLHKSVSDLNTENEELKTENEKLRNEKLNAWDIPDGL